jgi:hypothetical protein
MALTMAVPIAAARRLWSALRSMLLRRACAAAKADLSTIGDARLLAIGWSKGDLLAVIDDLERTTIADIQTGD